MAGPVGHKGDQGVMALSVCKWGDLINNGADGPNHFQVGLLAVSADVVHLSGVTLL